MIPPPAGGGASAMNFHVLPGHRGRRGTAEASRLARQLGEASHGPAFRRGLRQVVG